MATFIVLYFVVAMVTPPATLGLFAYQDVHWTATLTACILWPLVLVFMIMLGAKRFFVACRREWRQ